MLTLSIPKEVRNEASTYESGSMRYMFCMGLLLWGNPGFANSIDIAIQHCVVPQILGHAFEETGLTPITAEEAGATPRDLPWYETREFFKIAGTQLQMHTGYRFGLRACLVSGLQLEEFDLSLTAFADQITSLGMKRVTDCPEYIEGFGHVAFFTSTARSERGNYITASIQSGSNIGDAEVLMFETIADNANQDCTDAD